MSLLILGQNHALPPRVVHFVMPPAATTGEHAGGFRLLVKPPGKPWLRARLLLDSRPIPTQSFPRHVRAAVAALLGGAFAEAGDPTPSRPYSLVAGLEAARLGLPHNAALTYRDEGEEVRTRGLVGTLLMVRRIVGRSSLGNYRFMRFDAANEDDRRALFHFGPTARHAFELDDLRLAPGLFDVALSSPVFVAVAPLAFEGLAMAFANPRLRIAADGSTHARRAARDTAMRRTSSRCTTRLMTRARSPPT